jgi:protoporphyrinogen oxidase
MSPAPKIAIIIGAGPAGLTAAYELLTRTDIKPIVLEKSRAIGGLSRTVNYQGNRMDLGGHRFFSKSDRVMNWWLQQMPLQKDSAPAEQIAYHGMTRNLPPTAVTAQDPASTNADHVMLLRKRKSRIYFLGKFFTYPISLSWDTLRKLGLSRTARIGFSYLRSALLPTKNPSNLEQFFINRFGRELYQTFFKSYTEKVWGVPCREISAAWGEQRIKGLSIRKAISHFISQLFRTTRSVAQKDTETSLIEKFLYPKFGPGQMWEGVAQKIVQLGGKIITDAEVVAVRRHEHVVTSVLVRNTAGTLQEFAADYFLSTMAVKDLISAMGCELAERVLGKVPDNVRESVPENVRAVSAGLQYRDFITVGVLARKLKVSAENGGALEDNWIYLQEPDIRASRLQIINNWSPSMVATPGNIWMGVEYFCYDTDDLWKASDQKIAALAIAELDKIGIIDKSDVLNSTVIRIPRSHPAYFGTFARFNEVRAYTDTFPNLFLLGRNGMHRYNNQDHSMLTAMVAVDNIVANSPDKSNLWSVNTEMEYLESAT